ncbi:MAG: peptide/nickel transport system permease protein [Phycisphaerales bacterium]
MIKRFLKSRGWRKFRRNRLALFATGVIGVYLLFALLILPPIRMLSLAETQDRVLPRHTPWFLQGMDEEKEYDDLRWMVTTLLDNAFEIPGGLGASESPGMLLDSVALAERTVADRPIPELEGLWGELTTMFEVLDENWMSREDALFEQADYVSFIEELEADPGHDPEELAGEREGLDEITLEIAEMSEEVAVQLAGAQSKLNELMPMPSGYRGAIHGFRTFLGSDESGRSVSVRAFFSIKVAFQVGFVAAIVSVFVGTLLGAAAGFYGGWVDHAVMWVVSTLSSIPYLVLLAVLVYAFRGSDLFDNPREHPALALVPVYAAFCLTFWVGTCRVIRGEVMKIKELEYVQAATAIGFGKVYILLRHVIPNTTHIMFINFSLIFIGAIKSEVILSFLGLGVKGQPSWGVMISLGREDVQNLIFWTVLSPTALMFGLVLAFNIVSDALQDAFDPRHVS